MLKVFVVEYLSCLKNTKDAKNEEKREEEKKKRKEYQKKRISNEKK